MDTPPPSSHATGVRTRVNANTLMGGTSPSLAGVGPIDVRAAYRDALVAHRAMPKEDEPGYRLFAIREGRTGYYDLPARPGAFAVLGRHSRCDLLLDGDPRVALRHLLARAELTTDGGWPGLRLLDLRTTTGFRLADGGREDAVRVVGPVALHTGRVGVVAIPMGAGTPDLPDELPPLMVEPKSVSPDRGQAEGDPPARTQMGWTHVTLAPRLSELHDLRSTGSGRLPGPPATTELRPFARLDLRAKTGGESVDVSLAELDRGILLGRASKCDKRFTRLLDERVSRAHLLLLREPRPGRPIVAFDLASTNGTFESDKRMRSFELPQDRALTIRIGVGDVTLTWEPVDR